MASFEHLRASRILAGCGLTALATPGGKVLKNAIGGLARGRQILKRSPMKCYGPRLAMLQSKELLREAP